MLGCENLDERGGREVAELCILTIKHWAGAKDHLHSFPNKARTYLDP